MYTMQLFVGKDSNNDSYNKQQLNTFVVILNKCHMITLPDNRAII